MFGFVAISCLIFLFANYAVQLMATVIESEEELSEKYSAWVKNSDLRKKQMEKAGAFMPYCCTTKSIVLFTYMVMISFASKRCLAFVSSRSRGPRRDLGYLLQIPNSTKLNVNFSGTRS